MNSLRDLIARSCALHPDRIAFIDASTALSLTYSQFDAESNRVANALVFEGLAPGDTVGLLMPNSVAALIAEAALAKIGATCVPLNYRLSGRELGWQLDHAGASTVYSGGEMVDRAVEATAFASRDVRVICAEGVLRDSDKPGAVTIIDPAQAASQFAYPGALDGSEAQRISYTSATTGMPKGVRCPSRHINDNAQTILNNQLSDMRAGDTYLAVTPLTHMAIGWVWPVFKLGATTVVAPRFRADEFIEYVEKYTATHTLFAPTMVVMLLEHLAAEPALIARVRASSLRALWYAGSGMAPSVSERAERVLGPILGQQYGFTELWSATSSMCCTYLPPEFYSSKRGSCGKQMVGAEVKIVDDGGNSVPAGVIGEIWVATSPPVGGYLDDAHQTEATFGGGWVRSGDLGRFDDDGFLFLTDRIKDVIISGGFNIYSAEVEAALAEHEAVLECAVVGTPDEVWGEVPWAYVSLRHDHEVSEEELVGWVRERLAHYKSPRRVVFLDVLPKSHYGKILKRELRQLDR